jgi:hypothetical protein
LRQNKLRTKRADRPADARPQRGETYDKLLHGLTELGFRRKQTCAVLDALRSGKGPVAWTASPEELLRAAMQLLAK